MLALAWTKQLNQGFTKYVLCLGVHFGLHAPLILDRRPNAHRYGGPHGDGSCGNWPLFNVGGFYGLDKGDGYSASGMVRHVKIKRGSGRLHL